MKYIVFLFLGVVNFSCTTTSIIGADVMKFGFENVDTLVDIGSGYGYFDADISWQYHNIHFILEDIDPKYKKLNGGFFVENKVRNNFKDRCEMYIGTDSTIPLPSSAYKMVVCRKALHEFSNPLKMAIELNRILRIGGTLIIMEAKPSFVGQTDPYCKKQYLPAVQIINLFQTNGFELISSDEINKTQKPSEPVGLAVLKFTKRYLPE